MRQMKHSSDISQIIEKIPISSSQCIYLMLAGEREESYFVSFVCTGFLQKVTIMAEWWMLFHGTRKHKSINRGTFCYTAKV